MFIDKVNSKNIEKGWQCTITWHLGAFEQPLLQLKSNKYYIFLVYVCSLRYPAYKVHASYCHLWSAWL